MYLMFDKFRFDIRYVFFFKQKTAYEMRISDWSSDVCSSDLDVRDFTESVTFEERVGATVVLTALEEDPLHAAVAGFAFDFRHHPRTQPGRSLRRLDREVGQRREACATADTPFDDRGADQRAVGRTRPPQAGCTTPAPPNAAAATT